MYTYMWYTIYTTFIYYSIPYTIVRVRAHTQYTAQQREKIQQKRDNNIILDITHTEISAFPRRILVAILSSFLGQSEATI